LKYRYDFPVDGFERNKAARNWVLGFVAWYNNEHHHSAIRFVSPNQRHSGADIVILAERRRLYDEARAANPSRWSRSTRNWTPKMIVTLNPERTTTESIKVVA